MKLSYLFAAALISSLAFSSPTHAAVVNLLPGDGYSFGSPVVAGQTGTVETNNRTESGVSGTEYDFASGVLAPHTQVVFSYQAHTGDLDSYSVSTNITGANFTIEASSSNASKAPPHINSTTDNLVTVAANFASQSGTATITNFSSSAVNFFAYVLSRQDKRDVTTSYIASTVPLPPSAVLFLTGLMAFAGFSIVKKTRNQV